MDKHNKVSYAQKHTMKNYKFYTTLERCRSNEIGQIAHSREKDKTNQQKENIQEGLKHILYWPNTGLKNISAGLKII